MGDRLAGINAQVQLAKGNFAPTPVSVGDLYATICAALGVDHTKENLTPEGRPISLVDKGSTPIAELIG